SKPGQRRPSVTVFVLICHLLDQEQGNDRLLRRPSFTSSSCAEIKGYFRGECNCGSTLDVEGYTRACQQPSHHELCRSLGPVRLHSDWTAGDYGKLSRIGELRGSYGATR